MEKNCRLYNTAVSFNRHSSHLYEDVGLQYICRVAQLDVWSSIHHVDSDTAAGWILSPPTEILDHHHHHHRLCHIYII